MTKTAD